MKPQVPFSTCKEHDKTSQVQDCARQMDLQTTPGCKPHQVLQARLPFHKVTQADMPTASPRGSDGESTTCTGQSINPSPRSQTQDAGEDVVGSSAGSALRVVEEPLSPSSVYSKGKLRMSGMASKVVSLANSAKLRKDMRRLGKRTLDDFTHVDQPTADERHNRWLTYDQVPENLQVSDSESEHEPTKSNLLEFEQVPEELPVSDGESEEGKASRLNAPVQLPFGSPSKRVQVEKIKERGNLNPSGSFWEMHWWSVPCKIIEVDMIGSSRAFDEVPDDSDKKRAI